jgi:hypothetical protein
MRQSVELVLSSAEQPMAHARLFLESVSRKALARLVDEYAVQRMAQLRTMVKTTPPATLLGSLRQAAGIAELSLAGMLRLENIFRQKAMPANRKQKRPSNPRSASGSGGGHGHHKDVRVTAERCRAPACTDQHPALASVAKALARTRPDPVQQSAKQLDDAWLKATHEALCMMPLGLRPAPCVDMSPERRGADASETRQGDLVVFLVESTGTGACGQGVWSPWVVMVVQAYADMGGSRVWLQVKVMTALDSQAYFSK